ncbi:MAG: N-6 DNA methylase [Prolixibacteraceae bacterium]|nr:N-6 DNA methylase [Prolixibacteraceae bacterium]
MDEFLDKEVTDLSDEDFENKYGILISDQDAKNKLLKEFTKIRLEKNNEFAIKEVFDSISFEENAKVVKEVVVLLQEYKIRYTKKQQYLSDFFELLLTTGLKQESGQFFTPVPIAQFIIKSIPLDLLVKEKLGKGKRNELLPAVIDYASGSGHFVTESMHEIQKIITSVNSNDFIADTKDKLNAWKTNHFDWAFDYVYGIEKDYRLVKVGKVGCYLHGDGLAKVIHSDGLANFSENIEYKSKLKNTNKDFPQDNNEFDIVVSNPPYSVSSFKNNARKYYTKKDFSLYSKLTDNSSEIECLFIERTKQLLKPNGVAGIILPSSILSNSGIYSKTRELFLQYFEIIGITELGSNTFMATGTNTVVLFLRRRDNYFIQNLKIKVERAVNDIKDVTINGIEKPIAKYISHVWEGISFDDYKTLLKKSPNEKAQQHEIYQEYAKKIKAKSEKEFWNSILALEQDKLLYFIIAYAQKLVLVKTGEKNAEKQFLGYEFSNRRGSEGIHPIQRSKTIDECTQLYDVDSFTNPEKASYYIYKAFTGEFDLEIAEKLKPNISYQNLVDMLTFDRVDFEKNISLSAKKKVKIESKWKQVKIGNLTKLIKRGKSAKYGKSEIQIIKSGQARGLKEFDFTDKHFVSNDFILDERKLEQGDLLINSSGVGTAGRVTLFNLEGIFVVDSHISIVRLNHNQILSGYALACFAKIGFKTLETLALGQSGQIEMTINTIENIKIPLPPKNIQKKIVSEIEVLEKQEQKAVEEIQKQKLSIISNFVGLKHKTGLLGDIASFKNGLNYNRQSLGELITIIGVGDFKDDFSPNLNNLEKIQIDGQLSEDYELKPKDILVVRSNGSARLVGRFLYINEINEKTSYSGFTIRIRVNSNEIDSKYLCHYLKTDVVRNELTTDSKGSNIKSLNQGLLSSIKVPLPTFREQEIIVSDIERIEKNIADLEKQIELIPKQKELVLNKYLE